MAVVFIDTSILCTLLNVPGKAQGRDEVMAEYSLRRDVGDTFILPFTAVIETANHIEQLGDGLGDARRRCAEALEAMLRLIASNQEPWVLHELAWDSELLRRFCDGHTETPAFVDVATRGDLGGGDLAILIERARYCERTNSAAPVEIWTKDGRLASYA